MIIISRHHGNAKTSVLHSLWRAQYTLRSESKSVHKVWCVASLPWALLLDKTPSRWYTLSNGGRRWYQGTEHVSIQTSFSFYHCCLEAFENGWAFPIGPTHTGIWAIYIAIMRCYLQHCTQPISGATQDIPSLFCIPNRVVWANTNGEHTLKRVKYERKVRTFTAWGALKASPCSLDDETFVPRPSMPTTNPGHAIHL